MIKLVDRYVGLAAVLGILGVWLGLTVLFVVFNLLDELREVRADYGVVDALWFVVLTIPRMAYQVFPVSALLGALVGVGGLAAANELVAFRTSGISRLRLSLAALAGTMLVTVPVMVMGEWVAPAAEQQARLMAAVFTTQALRNPEVGVTPFDLYLQRFGGLGGPAQLGLVFAVPIFIANRHDDHGSHGTQ